MPPEQKLLLTKLYKPRAVSAWIPRPRLMEALDAGLSRKLILVDAPAGYGKTTLLAQWLDAQSICSAWLSLDEADNDIGTFLSYLAQAVRTVYPDTMPTTAMLLSAVQIPTVDELANTLINELDALPGEIILVLDDYHIIQSPAIAQLMSRLIQHPPSSLHLVMTTRMDPTLPLATLRARGAITEIRATDLRFSSAETQLFLAGEASHMLGAGEAQLLANHTEGWPAALRLVTLSLKTADDAHAFIEAFVAEGSAHVTSFLLHEVLGGLSERTRDFLLRMALLDRFCAPLCHALQDADDAAGETQDARALLAEIRQQNLFLVPLDSRGEWFRFHHLFRDLLRSQLHVRLHPDAIAGLHRQASDWLALHGWVEEAMQQARAAGDVQRVLHLVESNMHTILDREEWMTLSRWLTYVPQAMIEGRPRLMMARVYVKFLRNELTELPPLLDQVERTVQEDRAALAPAEVDALLAEILVMRLQASVSAGSRRDETAIAAFDWALQHLPATHRYTRGIAIIGLGMSMQMHGRKQDAEARLRAELAQTSLPDGYSLRILFTLWVLKWFGAEIGVAGDVTERYLVDSEDAGLVVSSSWAHTFAGLRHYEINDLDAAIGHFEWVAAREHQSNLITQVIARTQLVLAQQAAGRPDLADATLDNLRAHAKDMHVFTQTQLFDSIAARLQLLRGDVASAAHWARSPAAQDAPNALVVPELPTLTQAQVLVAMRSPDLVSEALSLLLGLRKLVEAQHYHFPRLKIMAAQASALWWLNQHEAALQLMAEAMDMGWRGGLVRSFADLGADVLTVLHALAPRIAGDSARHDYISRVIAAFSSAPAPAAAPAESTSLTQREVEVLDLLSRNRSDKEIAGALVLSRLTVSRHTANIYRKLGVGNRREAVARGRALGLIAQAQ